MLKVTIAIPTYNRVNRVKNAIDSALSQTYAQIEIIVSDNASTDGTFDVISEYESDGVFILGQKTNIGMVDNWNACLNKSSGDYFILLSDDDLLEPTFVEKCIGSINKDASEIPAIIYTRANVINNSSIYITKPGIEFESGNDFVVNWFEGKREIYLCGTMYNARFLKEIGGFPKNPVIMTDSAAIAAVSLLGNIAHVNECLTSYEWHSESISSRTSLCDWVDDDYDLSCYVVKHSPNELQPKLKKIMSRRAFRCALGRIYHESFHVNNKFSSARLVILHAYKKYGMRYMLNILSSSSSMQLLIPSNLFLFLKKFKKISHMRPYDFTNLFRREYLKIKTRFFYALFLGEAGKGSYIDKPILFAGLQYIKIGKYVILFKNCRIELLDRYGRDHFTPELKIGDYTQIHQNAHITCANSIKIGSNVVITSNVTITDINHLYDDINIPINLQRIEVRPVSIGDQSYIYNNSVILPGVSIGKHCVVAANSLVTSDIPDYCLVAGSPAKIVKSYNHNKKTWEKVQ